MSDERLRLLEVAATTGDPGARLRLLAERARMGQVDLDALRLAAYCGDLDARTVLGPATPAVPNRSKAWFLGLAAFGKPVSVRAALALGRLVLPTWNQLGLRVAVAAVGSADEWLRCPCENHRRRAAGFADLAAVSMPTTARAGVNIARAASRRDSRLAAKDCAAAAWNLRETFRGLTTDQLDAALARCQLRRPPGLGEVRTLVAAHLRAADASGLHALRRAR